MRSERWTIFGLFRHSWPANICPLCELQRPDGRLNYARRMAEAIDQAGPRLPHPPKIDPFED